MTLRDRPRPTLEEKAALLSGRDLWSTQPVEHAGIPSIVLTDGPHGVRRQRPVEGSGLHDSLPATCFPPAVAIGSSWNPSLAEQVGVAVGQEARALDVQVVLGPGVNIKRSPLCGRNFEYYSEDPLLSGALGTAHVQGLQSVGVGACVKHFAANNQETDRMRISADVDERTLREIYLPAFEKVVKDATPATVMCAYNQINGVPAAHNSWLLTELLRDEWGHTGLVVSDWAAVTDPVRSVRAGLDLEMPGTSGRSVQRVVEAVRAGDLDEAVVDAAVDRLLDLVDRTTGGDIGTDLAAGDIDRHHDLAREVATECAVLLKNEGALPLVEGARVAVIGELARSPRYQGGGSSRVTATRVDAPLDALRTLGTERGGTVDFAAGYTVDESGDASDLLREAVEAARTADVAVVFAGRPESDESEGFDRPDISLPTAQTEVIRAVAAAAARTVVVLSNGLIASVEGWHQDVDAILEGFLLGQAGGSALANLLLGIDNPSGRLAESMPVRLSDTASFVNFPGEQGHVRYGEGVMVGYRWHETVGIPCRYPFGHGLSYTTFAVHDLGVDVTGDDSARATVSVTNSGERPGKHVVQLYVATEAGPVRRPVRELRAFDKVELAPGETRTLTFDLGRRAFAHWDITSASWVVPAGTYVVQVCQDAATVTVEEPITLRGDDTREQLTLESTVEEWSTQRPDVFAGFLAAIPADSGVPELTPELLRVIAGMPLRKVADLLGDAVPTEVLDQLVAGGPDVVGDDGGAR
ncbi:beta-glucosidase [Janibacter sp. Soil728]|uniref:glycoside hydrolase family 3 C-terminal domain-containing protein n=1 Tax=Janibacter sp. Soil728 TaxID=1736393 RepID=UPI000701D28A|nr:glycoside hydrolase family 3 C-terminal domain-containing protein [Janibacter sp. Soil728]KRE38855.1 beta-glucosidase [Janibacter sp. Soil728]